MSGKRSIFLEKSDSSYCLRVEPPLNDGEISEIPEASFYGGKGRESIEPQVQRLEDATIISTHGWVFNRGHKPEEENERFIDYAHSLAETIGNAACDEYVQII